jgi:hypothetical protein
VYKSAIDYSVFSHKIEHIDGFEHQLERFKKLFNVERFIQYDEEACMVEHVTVLTEPKYYKYVCELVIERARSRSTKDAPNEADTVSSTETKEEASIEYKSKDNTTSVGKRAPVSEHPNSLAQKKAHTENMFDKVSGACKSSDDAELCSLKDTMRSLCFVIEELKKLRKGLENKTVRLELAKSKTERYGVEISDDEIDLLDDIRSQLGAVPDRIDARDTPIGIRSVTEKTLMSTDYVFIPTAYRYCKDKLNGEIYDLDCYL